MNELEALLILNAIPGLGPMRIRKMIGCFGSGPACLKLSPLDLKSAHILPEDVIDEILKFPKEDFLSNELKLMKEHGVEAVAFGDALYPKLLSEIPDAPVVLYIRGDLHVCQDPSMAIVGSRRASIYGLSTAEKMALQLAEMGIVVVSGLARGIDRAAHQGVLKAKGKTAAVLGSGLADIYPPENIKLADLIAREGLLVSEFPMTMPPHAFNFPRRNRVISGLSQGVIVVEASQKSGALITADFALEQGREVYAVPGKIDQASAAGVNNLIKQGAKLITCVEDVLEDLLPNLKTSKQTDVNRIKSQAGAVERVDLSDEEQLIYQHICDRPIHIDELISLCSSSIPRVGGILLKLELKRLVKQLPGKLFVR